MSAPILPSLKCVKPPKSDDLWTWLARYDRHPRLLPRMPASSALALVAAARVANAACAWLLDEESQLQVLRDGLESMGGQLPLLFFHIPRSVL